MRYNKNRSALIGVIALLAVVLLALVVVAVMGLNGNGPESKPDGTTESTKPNEQKPANVIETPYGDIVFPEKLAKYLKVERTEVLNLELDFVAVLDDGKTQELFALRFGTPEEPAIGQLLAPEGEVVGVYVTVYQFSPDDSWEQEDILTVTGMQEALNDVLQSLSLDPLGTQYPGAQEQDVVIKTPYADLHFPGQWAEELVTVIDETDGYEVVFQGAINGHDPIPLFALNFGGSKGTEVHVVYTENDMPVSVRLRTFELQMDGWSDADQATARAMKEDLNHILAKLREE